MCWAMPPSTTDGGGRIAISAAEVGTEVEIRVRDTGIGIPVELMPMIFNLFTQLDRTSGPAQSGLGIGLALVQRLVEMHGGSIQRIVTVSPGQRVRNPSTATHGGERRARQAPTLYK